MTRRCAALSCRISFVFWLALSSSAERLPIKTYTVGDGLAHNSVKQIFQDAKGFLWIATFEGLSRFDGYDFTNYDADDGLGHIFVNDVTADNQGRLWAATNGGGVSLLIDEPPENSSGRRKKFISFQIATGGENNPANAVNRILFDAENRLWCATDDGLYRAASLKVAADYGFEKLSEGRQPTLSNGALRDSRGRLWFGIISAAASRVIQIANGKSTEYEVREADSAAPLEIHTIIETGSGHILAAGLNSIFEFIEPPQEGERGAWRKFPIALPPLQIQTIAAAPDGGLWISAGGLLRVHEDRRNLYTTANGLGANAVSSVFYDREGNLWIGTLGGGLSKLSGESIATYTVAQGLPHPDVYRVIEDQKGRIYAQSGCLLIEITEDNRIVPLPDIEKLYDNSCSQQLLLQDSRGNWWFNSRQGVKFSTDAALNLQRGKLVLDEKLQPFNYSEIYEDATGDVWLSNIPTSKLYRIEKGNPQNLSVAAENVQVEFIVRDKNSGTVWIASRTTIWRVRGGGEVKAIEKIEGLPVLQPRALFQDSRGRIFVGTRYHGALFCEEPEADQPRFFRLTTAEGLASNTVWEIAEDDQGKIYFGTGRGVDQLDASSGKIHHFTADEGAINSAVVHFLKDRRGNLWASTVNGLMRIDPRSLRQKTDAPPIFISQIRVAGEELPVAETGAAQIPAVELTAEKSNVAIRFVGLSFQGGNALRYEYKLDGVDADWVTTGVQREVNFANLGAGDYRFEVRAVNAENIKSPQPATFEFRLLRPIYLRWWFLALVSVCVAALIFLFYRYRLRRLLEIERTRTRIATDLHDDIGANLSKISLLSDIANMQMTDGNAESRRILTTIAEVSRTSVAAMRDIVWAINPQRDTVLEMTRKMRQYAEEIFVEKGVRVKFAAPADGANVKLSMDVRRELFLIFKEAVNNAARHSDCSQLEIFFTVAGGGIFLRIADDGRGFDAARDFEGNGLSNMKTRAEKIGGRFEIKSETGSGTAIKIKI